MIETLESHRSFEGTQSFHRHHATTIGLPMRFGVYRPDGCDADAPALLYLAGLTCTEETFAVKAGAQRFASQHRVMLVTADTSPRGTGIDGATKDWDFGEGAGFYLDATVAPWAEHFRMESYLVAELIPLLVSTFGVDRRRLAVFGHSMGGHGALTLALRHPDLFGSVSAFAPIAAPSRSPWGEKAFGRYLGDDRAAWAEHDASALIERSPVRFPHGILVDQGLEDGFLDRQLFPEALETACHVAGQPLTLRRHAGHDHGYYFVSTFVADHIAFHARALRR